MAVTSLLLTPEILQERARMARRKAAVRGTPQTYSRPDKGTREEKPWPAFLTFTELMEPVSPPAWEIEPLFNRGDRIMFYGEPGSRKSWLLMHMGICLAAGLPWLGKFGVSEPRKVLYIDKEMGAWRDKWRCERLVRGMGLSLNDIPFRVWPKPSFMVDVKGPSRLLDLFEEQSWQPDVIIMDSFRRVLEGDENDSGAINQFWNEVSVLSEAGITLLFIHHTNRSGKWRGSQDILAGLEMMIEVDGPDSEGITSIIPEKDRDGNDIATFGVKLIGGPAKSDPVELLYAGEIVADSPSKAQQTAQSIYEYVEKQPGKRAKRATIDAHLVPEGYAVRTITRALRDMVTMGTLDKHPGGIYEITPEIGS